jgi:hypothetical protein
MTTGGMCQVPMFPLYVARNGNLKGHSLDLTRYNKRVNIRHNERVNIRHNERVNIRHNERVNIRHNKRVNIRHNERVNIRHITIWTQTFDLGAVGLWLLGKREAGTQTSLPERGDY